MCTSRSPLSWIDSRLFGSSGNASIWKEKHKWYTHTASTAMLERWAPIESLNHNVFSTSSIYKWKQVSEQKSRMYLEFSIITNHCCRCLFWKAFNQSLIVDINRQSIPEKTKLFWSGCTFQCCGEGEDLSFCKRCSGIAWKAASTIYKWKQN